MLSGTACMRVNFSAADERLAAILYRRGVTLAHLRLSWEWDPLRKDPRFQKILADAAAAEQK